MVNIFLRAYNNTTHLLSINPHDSYQDFHSSISTLLSIPASLFYLTTQGGKSLHLLPSLSSLLFQDGSTIEMKLKIHGGIDFQHREGSKFGSGGNLSESQAALERKERLRKLALETIDITKDPYILRNHLGTYECKLCLTLHNNEGNYLAHTQGKRHQVRCPFLSYSHVSFNHLFPVVQSCKKSCNGITTKWRHENTDSDSCTNTKTYNPHWPSRI
jgi:hypothetical protein